MEQKKEMSNTPGPTSIRPTDMPKKKVVTAFRIQKDLKRKLDNGHTPKIVFKNGVAIEDPRHH